MIWRYSNTGVQRDFPLRSRILLLDDTAHSHRHKSFRPPFTTRNEYPHCKEGPPIRPDVGRWDVEHVKSAIVRGRVLFHSQT